MFIIPSERNSAYLSVFLIENLMLEGFMDPPGPYKVKE